MMAESFAPILESYAQRYLERLPVANGEDPWVEAKEGSLASWVMGGFGVCVWDVSLFCVAE